MKASCVCGVKKCFRLDSDVFAILRFQVQESCTVRKHVGFSHRLLTCRPPCFFF
ncbi:hypothetical protein HanRHA438_Chr09g0417251 [Helianthus annuus]|nr:hypothetical protein HanRHA438_Chr09g0417251 [Helianthus annuus]